MTVSTWTDGGVGSAYETTGNWDTGIVPNTANDKAIINTGSAAITTAGAITVGEINVGSSFSGSLTIGGDLTVDDSGTENGNFTWDGGTYDANGFNTNTDGNVLLSAGTITMGSGTWTVIGNWDHENTGAFNGDTSTVVMTGTAKTVDASGSTTKTFNNLTISSGATISQSSTFLSISGVMTVTGTFTVGSSSNILTTTSGFDLKIPSGGLLTGLGDLEIQDNGKISQIDGTIDIADIFVSETSSGSIVAAQYDCVNFFFQKQNTNGVNSTLTLLSGTYIFTGNLIVDDNGKTGTYTIANNTNNPNIEVRGNLTIAQPTGVVTWTKGTGTIKFSGSGTQTITTLGKSLEDITSTNVSAGGVVFDDALNTGALVANALTADILITFDETAAHVVGDFTQITGTTPNLVKLRSQVSGNQWDVSSTTFGKANHVDVKDSNLSGAGISVRRGVDSGNNTANWIFQAIELAGKFNEGFN